MSREAEALLNDVIDEISAEIDEDCESVPVRVESLSRWNRKLCELERLLETQDGESAVSV